MSGEAHHQVLVVDDSASIRERVAGHLSDAGYEVIEAHDGIEGLDLAIRSLPDVIVLDVVMPGIDGVRLCSILRERGMRTPVIMLTEKGDISDKVSGFSAGADDYLPKPFDPRELELRIQALIRRSTDVQDRRSSGRIRLGELEIDFDRHAARVSGRDVGLTPIEFKILSILASSPGRVFSRQDLLFSIWDTEYPGYKRNIDPHVTRLRNKIETNPKRPAYILTVWGVGYKLNDSLL